MKIGNMNVKPDLTDLIALIGIICGFYFGGFWIGMGCIGLVFGLILWAGGF